MIPPLDRAQFAVTENGAYLNHAAVGVLPRSSQHAIERFAAAHATGGVLGVHPFESRLPEFRAAVAGFIGASAHEIAFLRNTGDGANVLAAGLPWSQGDEILTNDNEFPSNAYPWLACRHFGASVRFIDTGAQRMTPDVLRQTISERTKLVALSWVGFNDGYRHDLAALAAAAHERGALLCVDVIQGVGAFDLDVHACDIDAAYAGGAKWMMALQGVSFLYVRENLIDRLRVSAPGWRSALDMWDFLNYEQPFVGNAARFEGGTPNLIGALSMTESIRVLGESARERHAVQRHVLSLTDELYEGLMRLGATVASVRGPGISSGIVTFSLPGVDPVELGKALGREGITTTYRSSGVRVSPHGYNTLDEIGRLLEVASQAVPARRSA